MRRLAVLLLVAAAACGGGREQAAPAAGGTPTATLSGEPTLEPAHDFSLRTFDGDTFTLSDHFGELPVVLNFWAPW